jgi:hypothetical protein
MVPRSAHGFMIKSLVFNQIQKIIPAVDKYFEFGFPLQTLALREETMGGKGNF